MRAVAAGGIHRGGIIAKQTCLNKVGGVDGRGSCSGEFEGTFVVGLANLASQLWSANGINFSFGT